MKKSNNRRSFIKKMAALSSLAVVGKAGFSSSKEEKMEAAKVTNIKPLGFQWETRDPFLFCVHHEDFYPKGTETMGPPKESLEGRNIGQDFLLKDGWRMYHGSTVPGFPEHPHRGFETVTVVRKGLVDHSDSMGGAGRYGNGDVQWLTSGKGVQHAEMFPLLNQDKENTLELFQIWLNLPKADKFSDPHYKMLWSEDIPLVKHKDQQGKLTKIEVIAGAVDKHVAPPPTPNSWAANPKNELAIWILEMEAGAQWTLPTASAGINRTLYFFEGQQLKVGDESIENYHSADLDPTAALTLESGSEKCRILILQAKAIDEPVVQHGPFVMNTQEEITQAFTDYQRTEFGGWPWEQSGPVHPMGQGRFAKHGDGSIENRG